VQTVQADENASGERPMTGRRHLHITPGTKGETQKAFRSVGVWRWWNGGGLRLIFATGAVTAAFQGDDFSLMDEGVDDCGCPVVSPKIMPQ